MQNFWLLVGDNAMTHFSIGTVALFFAASVILLLALKKPAPTGGMPCSSSSHP